MHFVTLRASGLLIPVLFIREHGEIAVCNEHRMAGSLGCEKLLQNNDETFSPQIFLHFFNNLRLMDIGYIYFCVMNTSKQNNVGDQF